MDYNILEGIPFPHAWKTSASEAESLCSIFNQFVNAAFPRKGILERFWASPSNSRLLTLLTKHWCSQLYGIVLVQPS